MASWGGDPTVHAGNFEGGPDPAPPAVQPAHDSPHRELERHSDLLVGEAAEVDELHDAAELVSKRTERLLDRGVERAS